MSSDPDGAVGPGAESNLLLQARGIGKSYPVSVSPAQRLREALFGTSSKVPSRIVLRDIDLDVFRGETVGIMGRNGAGKTTLLGILGRVLEPTAGQVERLSRIAVLLEIGAGFNPHFTGRQNADLFCSVMGLTREQTRERMPSIAEFAELDDYFDMPLRTYSSGMQARLGFACAIHVDADLIIIDETLAVGDAAFRVKCYAHIKAMQARGQTFLLVSHSPNLIANFCTRTIVIEKGRKVFDGPPLDGLDCYKEIRESLEAAKKAKAGAAAASREPSAAAEPEHRLWLDNFRVTRHPGLGEGGTFCVEADLRAGAEAIAHPVVSYGIRNQEGITICSYDTSRDFGKLAALSAGEVRPLRMTFRNLLLPGTYFLSMRTAEQVGDVAVTSTLHHNVARFDLAGTRPNSGIADLDMTIEPADHPAGARHSARVPSSVAAE